MARARTRGPYHDRTSLVPEKVGAPGSEGRPSRVYGMVGLKALGVADDALGPRGA
jgi:hypothetical protein